MRTFLLEQTGTSPIKYLLANLNGDFIISSTGSVALRNTVTPTQNTTTPQRVDIQQPPPPPPPTFAKKAETNSNPFSQLQSRDAKAQMGFRTPPEVLDVMIDYVPTFFVNVQTLVDVLPPEVVQMFGSQSPLMFLKKYRFYFEVQQHHGVPEVKLRNEVTHPRRGTADVKFAAGVGSVDYLQNAGAAAVRKPPRSSEANLVMGLAPKCPSEFSPIGEFLSSVHEFVSAHPAFDSRIGVTGILEKYPEYFQIVDGKVRVRPSTVAPGALAEIGMADTPLKSICEKLMAALPAEDGKPMDTPALFAKLALEEKQAIKQNYRSFPRFLRMHGKLFVVSPDNTLVKRFVPELERSADALASERLESDFLSPSDPIHNIPVSMAENTSADWSIKELYDALPLMQAAELDDFRMILPTSVRDALPKDLGAELAKHPDYFSVWQYPDDETVTIVQRAKLNTPQPTADELARAMVPMVPQGGLTCDQLLRRVPLPIQRYLYRHGVKKVVEEHLKQYFIISGNKIMKVF